MNVPFVDLRRSVSSVRGELDDAVSEVLDEGWFILGGKLGRFEEDFARYCGSDHAVGVASGLDALSLSLRAAGIGVGDEVAVPAQTFIATWMAVSSVGATPVAIDVRPDTFLMDLEDLEAKLTVATRAVIPVHLYGQSVAMDRLMEISHRRGLTVIEDCAQAHGATWKGRPVGGWGHFGAFSFYPAKNLGAFGDGGAVITNDAAAADRVRQLRNYGSRKKYVHDVVGQNSRLDEIQAAFLTVQLRHIAEWNSRRSDIAQTYLRRLDGLTGLRLPIVSEQAEPVWHLFVVLVENRERVEKKLLELGVSTQVHYPLPCHKQPAYLRESRDSDCPVSEWLAQRLLSLPISPFHTDSEIAHVVDSVKEAMS